MTRRILAVAAAVILCMMCLAGCSEVVTGDPVPYDSLEDLSEAVGFEVLEPVILPDGYVKSGYYSVGDSIAEVLYLSGSNEIIYAMTPVKTVKSDISDYDDIYVSQINGHDVEMTLKDGYVVFGTVRIGDYTYCIRCTAGLSTGEFEQIARGFGVSPDEVELIEEIIEDYNATEKAADGDDSADDEEQTDTAAESDDASSATETEDVTGAYPETDDSEQTEESDTGDAVSDDSGSGEESVTQMTVTE